MTQNDLPTAVWSGSFCIFGVDIRCHTLSDGRRIVDADDFATLMASMNAPDNGADIGDLIGFNRWKLGVDSPEPAHD